MAAYAIRKEQRLPKIAACMTLRAAYGCMLSQQRIFGFRVIKGESGEHFLPSRGRMAVFATLFERAFVRIDVTIDAGPKLHVLVAHWTTRHIGFVALLACHLVVLTGERISCF